MDCRLFHASGGEFKRTVWWVRYYCPRESTIIIVNVQIRVHRSVHKNKLVAFRHIWLHNTSWTVSSWTTVQPVQKIKLELTVQEMSPQRLMVQEVSTVQEENG